MFEIHKTRRRSLVRNQGVPHLAGAVVRALFFLMVADALAKNPERFYTQTGTDETFEEIIKAGSLPQGRDSTKGVKGSVVKLNHELLRDGPNANRKIPKHIFLHTLGNSIIWPNHFSNWSRWYQEDGNTQIFRLFEGETNVRNSRQFAARIEAFSKVQWEEGDWHEWVGTFTILKPHLGIIFQARNNVNDWSVQLNMNDAGDVILNRRVGEDETIAEDMVGKPFHIRVRDNGLDYEVFLNGKKVGDGSYSRPEGQTIFRWGLYRGDRAMTHDAMILVTGAAIDPQDDIGKEEVSAEVPEEAKERMEEIPEGRPLPVRVWTNKDGRKVRARGVHKAGEDFIWLRAKGKWLAYPLAELSETDRAVLMKLSDSASP